ncbi:MAG: hypothetical protein ACJA0H_002162 [Francisellaceae bacterium]|jgi:hypothetical protein
MKKKIINSLLAVTLLSSTVLYAGPKDSALSVPGYFGSINNNTQYVIECSQVWGGYCANNPMPANGYLQMLPDPGSHMIKGHIMVFAKNEPGKYVDNISFTYKDMGKGGWKFVQSETNNLYKSGLTVEILKEMPDTILISEQPLSMKSTNAVVQAKSE